MIKRVLISAPYFLPVVEKFRGRLEKENIEIVMTKVNERLSEAELLALIADIDGVICGDDQFTNRVLLSAPRLKVISKWGTGIDSIDLAAAAELKIKVCSTPDAFTDAVADTTLGYILCFARRLARMDREVKSGIWSKPPGVSLKECSLGIIGIGNIGKAVARRARAFGMQLYGNDLKTIPASFVSETSIKSVSLENLLTEADFVTLHCDLNPTSFHLIGKPELSLMKSAAYLINTSRGSVIDEKALIDALGEQQIGGAALDVFEIEPLPADSPLRQMPNCLLAAHNSNSSPAAWEKVHESTVANLLRGLETLKSV